MIINGDDDDGSGGGDYDDDDDDDDDDEDDALLLLLLEVTVQADRLLNTIKHNSGILNTAALLKGGNACKHVFLS